VTFSLNLLPKFEINRIDSPNGRRYETPSGELYESVTTWLGRSEDNSWVEEWKNNVGYEVAEKITKQAANRGTRLHETFEQYLLNNPVDISSMSLLDRMRFVPFKKVLDEHVSNIRGLELKLYSHSLRMAGTTDCVADYDGKLSIIDFKTSKRRKKKEDITSYFLQCLIYSIMVEERYGLKVNNIVILMAIDGEQRTDVFQSTRKEWVSELMTRLRANPPRKG